MQWENGGSTNSYRMGKEGKYDLKLAQPPEMPENEDEEEEESESGNPSHCRDLEWWLRTAASNTLMRRNPDPPIVNNRLVVAR